MTQVVDLPIDSIRPDPNQPRKFFDEAEIGEMASSITLFGLIVPILVTKANDLFPIVDGEKRWRACVSLKKETMRAVVLEPMADATQRYIAQLVVNSVRSDLTPLERARAYKQLMESKGWSATELAKGIGVSKPNVTRYLSHDSLSPKAQALLESGKLSSAKAYALSRLTPSEQEDALKAPETIGTRDELEQRAKKPRASDQPGKRQLRLELPGCIVTLSSCAPITVSSLCQHLSELMRACKQARSDKLDVATMASVLKDKTAALASEGLSHVSAVQK